MRNKRTMGIDGNLADNCTRKALKDLDLTTLDAVYHLMATCQVFTYVATQLDPDGSLTRTLLTESEMKLLKSGMYVSQSIAKRIEKETEN